MQVLSETVDLKNVWKQQLNQLARSSAVAFIYIISQIRQSSILDTAKIANFALFESHLRYGEEPPTTTSRGSSYSRKKQLDV